MVAQHTGALPTAPFAERWNASGVRLTHPTFWGSEDPFSMHDLTWTTGNSQKVFHLFGAGATCRRGRTG